jgi:ketosteroid isomerase-like protein
METLPRDPSGNRAERSGVIVANVFEQTLHPFEAAVQAQDLAALEAALAPDATLISPITSRFRFEGSQQVTELMSVVLETLQDFQVVHQLGTGDLLAVVWRARVDGQDIEGVDTLKLDARGRVREIVLFVRPLPGLATLTNALVSRMARRRPRARFVAALMLVAPLALLTRSGERLVAYLVRPRGPSSGSS